MKPRYFRIAYTDVWNSIERVPLSKVDKNRFKYGSAILDGNMPEGNPFLSVLNSYRSIIYQLNKDYPELYHWIDTEQPDENGVFAY